MKSKIIVILSFILTYSASICSKDHTIFGKISNADNTPAEYILISFLNKENIIQSTQTDSLGNYRVNIDFPLTGCKLAISNWGNTICEDSIAYFEESSLEKNIQLEKLNSIAINEIVVKGRKNDFAFKGDRYVFTPEKSLKISNNVFDILKQTPLIKADDNGISLLFKTGTSIYINNKPIRIPLDVLVENLKSMPADNIKTIEIIANPGSEYEGASQGGIINIVLKKNMDEGFGGQIVAQDKQTRVNSQALNTSMRYHKNKVGLEGNISISDIHRKNKQNSDIIQKDGYGQHSNSVYHYKGIGVNFNLRGEYELNKQHLFNISVITRFTKPKTYSDNYTGYYQYDKSTQYDSLSYTHDKNKGDKRNNYFLNAGYSYKIDDKGQEFSLSMDYMDYLNEQHQYTNIDRLYDDKDPQNITQYSTKLPQKIKSHSLKGDYTLPFGKNNLKAGVFYSYNNSNNNFEWYDWANDKYIIDSEKSNLFRYKEYIGALYLTYQRDWSTQFSTKLGLRTEYTLTKRSLLNIDEEHWKSNKINLLPSLLLNYKPNDTWFLSYSLSSYVDRPPFWQLNPMKNYINENLYAVENPFLKNATIITQDLALSLKDRYNISLTYEYLRDDMSQFLVPDKGPGNISHFGRFNYGNRNSVNLTLSTSFSFFNDFWKGNFSVMIQHDHFIILDEELRAYYKNQGAWASAISLSNTFALSKKLNWWGYLNIKYYSPFTEISRKNRTAPIIDAEIKKIWNKWTVSVQTNHPFYRYKVTSQAINTNKSFSPYLKNNFTSYNDERSVLLRVSYRFGNNKTKRNQSANIANEEIQKRVQ